MTDFSYPKFNVIPDLPRIPRLVPQAEKEPADLALFEKAAAEQQTELDLSVFNTFADRIDRDTDTGPRIGSTDYDVNLFNKFADSLPPVGVDLPSSDPDDPVEKTARYIRSVGRPASSGAVPSMGEAVGRNLTTAFGLVNPAVAVAQSIGTVLGITEQNTESRGYEFLKSIGIEGDTSNPLVRVGAGLVDRFLDVLDLSDVPNRVGFSAIHSALTGENLMDAAGKAITDPTKAPHGDDILAAMGVADGPTRKLLGEGIDLVADWRNALFGFGGATKAVKGAKAVNAVRNFIAEPMGALGGGMLADAAGEKIDEAFGTNIHGAAKMFGQFLGAGVTGYKYEKAANKYVLGLMDGAEGGPGKRIGDESVPLAHDPDYLNLKKIHERYSTLDEGRFDPEELQVAREKFGESIRNRTNEELGPGDSTSHYGRTKAEQNEIATGPMAFLYQEERARRLADMEARAKPKRPVEEPEPFESDPATVHYDAKGTPFAVTSESVNYGAGDSPPSGTRWASAAMGDNGDVDWIDSQGFVYTKKRDNSLPPGTTFASLGETPEGRRVQDVIRAHGGGQHNTIDSSYVKPEAREWSLSFFNDNVETFEKKREATELTLDRMEKAREQSPMEIDEIQKTIDSMSTEEPASGPGQSPESLIRWETTINHHSKLLNEAMAAGDTVAANAHNLSLTVAKMANWLQTRTTGQAMHYLSQVARQHKLALDQVRFEKDNVDMDLLKTVRLPREAADAIRAATDKGVGIDIVVGGDEGVRIARGMVASDAPVVDPVLLPKTASEAELMDDDLIEKIAGKDTPKAAKEPSTGDIPETDGESWVEHLKRTFNVGDMLNGVKMQADAVDRLEKMGDGDPTKIPAANPNSPFFRVLRDVPAKEYSTPMLREALQGHFDTWWRASGNNDTTPFTKEKTFKEFLGYVNLMRAAMKGVALNPVIKRGERLVAEAEENARIDTGGFGAQKVDAFGNPIDLEAGDIPLSSTSVRDLLGMIKSDATLVKHMQSGDIREEFAAMARAIRDNAKFTNKLFDSFAETIANTRNIGQDMGFTYLGVEVRSGQEIAELVGSRSPEVASKAAREIQTKVERNINKHITAVAKAVNAESRDAQGLLTYLTNIRASAEKASELVSIPEFGLTNLSLKQMDVAIKVAREAVEKAAKRAAHEAEGALVPGVAATDEALEGFVKFVQDNGGKPGFTAKEAGRYGALINRKLEGLAATWDELDVQRVSKMTDEAFGAVFREQYINDHFVSKYGSTQVFTERFGGLIERASEFSRKLGVEFPKKITAESLLTRKGRADAIKALSPLVKKKGQRGDYEIPDSALDSLTDADNAFIRDVRELDVEAKREVDLAIASRTKMAYDNLGNELAAQIDLVREAVYNGGTENGIAMDALHLAKLQADKRGLDALSAKLDAQLTGRDKQLSGLDAYLREMRDMHARTSTTQAGFAARLGIASDNLEGQQFAKAFSQFAKRVEENSYTFSAKNTTLKQIPADVTETLKLANERLAAGDAKGGVAQLSLASTRLLPFTAAGGFRALWYNNVLSALSTAGVNFGSTGAYIGMDTAFQHAIDILRGTFGDTKAKYRAAGRIIGMGETMKSAVDALTQAWKTGTFEAEVFRHGIDPRIGRREALKFAEGTAGRNVMNYLEGPTRVLQTTDAMLHMIVYKMNLASEAAGIAFQEMYKKTGSKDLDRAAFAKRVLEIQENPLVLGALRGERLRQRAYKLADNAVFKGDMGSLGKFLEKGQNIHGIGMWMIPFLRTLYHITARGVDMVPGVGLISTITDIKTEKYGTVDKGWRNRNFNEDRLIRETVDEARSGSDVRFHNMTDEEIMKAKGVELTSTPGFVPDLEARLRRNVVGSFMALPAMFYAYNNGFLTGEGPPDPQEAAMLRADGWMPYSIKVYFDGKPSYISYANMGPVAFPLAMYASVGDEMKYRGLKLDDKTVLRLINATLAIFEDQPYAQGLVNVVGMMDSSRDRSGQFNRFIANVAGNYMPTGYLSAMNQVGRAMDPVNRKVNYSDPFNGTVQNVMSRLPFLREQLPESQDILGDPIKNTSRYLGDGLTGENVINQLGVRSQKGNQSRISSELLKYDVNIPPPPADVGGIPLTFEEKQEFQRLIGEAIKEEVEPLIASGYGDMSPDSIQTMFRTSMRRAGQRARKEFIATMSDAIERRESAKTGRSESLARRVAEVG